MAESGQRKIWHFFFGPTRSANRTFWFELDLTMLLGRAKSKKNYNFQARSDFFSGFELKKIIPHA